MASNMEVLTPMSAEPRARLQSDPSRRPEPRTAEMQTQPTRNNEEDGTWQNNDTPEVLNTLRDVGWSYDDEANPSSIPPYPVRKTI